MVTLDSDAAQRWIDKVAVKGGSAKTIRDTWLAAPRAVFAWVKRMRKLRERTHPEQGFRACVGILRLAKSYGRDRLEAACNRALEIGARSKVRSTRS
jgi:transposase